MILRMNYREMFFYACQKGDLHLVKTFIKNGIDINIRDSMGITALYIACQKGNVPLIKLLLECGANVNVKTIHKKTPLHLVVGKQDYKIAKLLLECGANANIKDEDGNTPLHIACIKGNIELVKLLINKNADINLKSKNGNISLHYASNMGNEEIVKTLINQGIDINEKNYSGKSAIDIACCNGYANIVNLLVKENANVPLNVIDWAIQKEEIDIIKSMAKRKDIAKYLIKKLIVQGKMQTLREIRNERININSMEKVEKESLLELAVNNNNVDIANILMACNFGGVNSTIQKLTELLNNDRVNIKLENPENKEIDIIRLNKIEKENSNILELLIQSRL